MARLCCASLYGHGHRQRCPCLCLFRFERRWMSCFWRILLNSDSRLVQDRNSALGFSPLLCWGLGFGGLGECPVWVTTFWDGLAPSSCLGMWGGFFSPSEGLVAPNWCLLCRPLLLHLPGELDTIISLVEVGQYLCLSLDSHVSACRNLLWTGGGGSSNRSSMEQSWAGVKVLVWVSWIQTVVPWSLPGSLLF